MLGLAHFVARSYQPAILAYRLMAKPDAACQANLAACFAMLDDAEKAELYRSETLRRLPSFKSRPFWSGNPFNTSRMWSTISPRCRKPACPIKTRPFARSRQSARSRAARRVCFLPIPNPECQSG